MGDISRDREISDVADQLTAAFPEVPRTVIEKIVTRVVGGIGRPAASRGGVVAGRADRGGGATPARIGTVTRGAGRPHQALLTRSSISIRRQLPIGPAPIGVLTDAPRGKSVRRMTPESERQGIIALVQRLSRRFPAVDRTVILDEVRRIYQRFDQHPRREFCQPS